jgi:hypothetical protein
MLQGQVQHRFEAVNRCQFDRHMVQRLQSVVWLGVDGWGLDCDHRL